MLDQTTFDLISKIAEDHSHKTFGYLSQEDLRSEIWVICLNLIKNYDYSRGPLENYLRRSVKNRLINKFKDITKSVRRPCGRCEFNDDNKNPHCQKFGQDKYECDKWRNYELSVKSRNSLLNASESSIERERNSSALDSVVSDELKQFLAKNISPKYKRDLEELFDSGKLSKQRMKKLKREIAMILATRNQFVQIKVGGEDASS